MASKRGQVNCLIIEDGDESMEKLNSVKPKNTKTLIKFFYDYSQLNTQSAPAACMIL